MNDMQWLLAKKYAHAFMNLYADHVPTDAYRNIPVLESFFRLKSTALTFLSIPHISVSKKIEMFSLLLTQLELPDIFMKIVRLVIEHKRGFLLPLIFHCIYRLYQERHNIYEFTLYSSHDMPIVMQEIFVQFLAQRTGATIEYVHVVDPRLIAGIRLQGKTFLWEDSINQRLNAMSHAFLTSH